MELAIGGIIILVIISIIFLTVPMGKNKPDLSDNFTNKDEQKEMPKTPINKQSYRELLENDEKTLLAYLTAMQRENEKHNRSVMINVRILTWITIIGIILGIFSQIRLSAL